MEREEMIFGFGVEAHRVVAGSPIKGRNGNTTGEHSHRDFFECASSGLKTHVFL
jgi:hypothetical protein